MFLTKKLNLSPWQRFKFALYKIGKDEQTAAEEIGLKKSTLRQRIYSGLRRSNGKRSPADEKIVAYIERHELDFDTGEQT